MKVAVVGVTGLVGQVMLRVLEQRNFPVTELIPAASQKSVGKTIIFKNKPYKVVTVESAIESAPQIALFSAGASASLKYAPLFADKGCFVIDNSSAWRMDADKPLVVPEINSHVLSLDKKIIANPNCSTIQMVVALNPLHKKYRIDRLVISTYQSVTGTGVKAVQQLENEEKGIDTDKVYPHQIYKNTLPQCDVFVENGYTKEEMKLVNETRKIFENNDLRITATAVRVPVVGGHSESVNVSFHQDFDLQEVRNLLRESDGIVLQDNVSENEYPMPFYAHNKDEVFVGRLRRDFSADKTLNMWIVADNLRKGAATNAVQIAAKLLELKLV